MRVSQHLVVGTLVVLLPALVSGAAVPNKEAGQAAVAGLWKGTYRYPDGSGQAAVNFQIVIAQQGATVVGFIKEPNTFGDRQEPWLHATFRGKIESGKLTCTKTYDGTAGPSHDVEYSGELKIDKESTKVEGTWSIGDFRGTFTLEKLKLDDQTIENVRNGPAKE